MIAIAFALGLLAGIALTVIAAIVVLNWPAPDRTHAPVRYSAIGACRAVDSSDFGKVPSDWSGSVWSPPGSSPRGHA
jgi:hypothetical protein